MPGSIEDQVRALIIETLPPSTPPEDVTNEARLDEGELGLDSVALVDLLCACEDEFDIDLPAAILLSGEFPVTVGLLISVVSKRAELATPP